MQLKLLNQELTDQFETLHKLKQSVRECYLTYLSTNKHTDMLDSFLFQSKLIDMQYDLYYKLFQFNMNRLYGDYYKLLITIHQYSIQHGCSKLMNEYSVYKDLEPYKVYSFDHVERIQEDITGYLNYLSDLVVKNDEEIHTHSIKI